MRNFAPSESSSSLQTPALIRTYTLTDAVLVGLGAIIGSGIYVALGPAALQAGFALLLALLLAAIPATLNALASAALGATFPRAGGTYHFARQTLGPVWGFTAGWCFLFAKLCSGAVMAQGFASYLLGGPGPATTLSSIGLVVVVTLLDLRGPRLSARVNLFLVVAKVSVLLLFVAVGFLKGNHPLPETLSAFAPNGWRGIWEGAALLFSVYAGYARIATLAEEVVEPRRTLPRAVFLSLGGSMLLYLLVAFAALRLTGAETLAQSAAPLMDALQNAGVPWAVPIVAAGAVVASASVFLVLLTGISRVMFAMARENDLPPILSTVSAGGVPTHAVLAAGGVVCLLCLVPSLTALLSVNSAAILTYYTLTNLAALRLDSVERQYPAFLCLAGAGCCLCLIAGLPWKPLALFGILLTVILLLGWLRYRQAGTVNR